jgi:glutamyl-Q tRNA(Asp) synthetase
MYRGRFAPSPTGPLHFGSLVAALASYLEARHQRGAWLLRIEDVDTTRARPDATRAILGTLESLGFRWDDTVIIQSERGAIYQQEIDRLGGWTYACGCSRKDVGDGPYPGTCRNGIPAGKSARATRLRVNNEEICFDDALQGRFCSRLEQDLGDFVLYRSDLNLYSYQLAVVVDDELSGITHVVRGADLLDSTPRQIWLGRLLGYRPLHYLHVPLATGPGGEKLSKQNLAPGIDTNDATRLLSDALEFLGQQRPPASLTLTALWDWAIAHWDRRRLPAVAKRPAP